MSNPFRQLQEEALRKKANDEPFEEVDGPMSCQECGETVMEGLLYPRVHIVTWTCSKGHTSKLTNYV